MLTKHRILYIEDDDQLGELTSQMLEELGYRVKWVRDGDIGIRMMEVEAFDLCVVDIMMPRIDGYSFTKLIRKEGHAIPVIFLSAKVLPADVVKGFETGGNDYIRKPFSMEELNARIKNLLNNTKPDIKDEVVSIGRYFFKYATYELRIDDRTYSLSPRLAHIFHKMLHSDQRILDKKEALIEIWGDDSFFNGRSLDVFISKLRKLLSEDANLQIVNIRSIGYKLIVKNG